MDDSVYAALVGRAQDEARALGRDRVDAEHILLALCQEDTDGTGTILAAAGITADSVRAWLNEHARGSGAPEGRLPCAPGVSFLFRRAWAEADGRRQSIGPRHVLVALLKRAVSVKKTSPGTGPRNALMALLRGRDTVDALYVQLIAHMYPAGFPYLGEELAANARLPGLRERWSRHGAVLAGYLCLAGLAVVLGPAARRDLALTVAAAAPVVLFPARHVLVRRLGRILLPDFGAETAEAAGLRAVLTSAGLRKVTVLTVTADQPLMRRRPAAAYRSGRTAMIALRSELKDPEKWNPDLTRFYTAHEAAHVARDDAMTQDLVSAGRLSLLPVVALTAPGGLWLLLPLAVLPAAVKWRAELACDRIAVEAAGRIPAREDVRYYSEVLEGASRRPLLRWVIWWTWEKFTYPPWRIRRNAIARVIAKDEHNRAPGPPYSRS